MDGLSLKIIKYKARVKNLEGDGSKHTYTEYPITDGEYAKLKIGIADKVPFIWIHDIEGNKIREINPRRDIKDFLPVTYQDNTTPAYFTCDFGVKHNLYNGDTHCDCSDRYGCIGICFLDKINESLGLNLFDKYDITDFHRQDYLTKLNTNEH